MRTRLIALLLLLIVSATSCAASWSRAVDAVAASTLQLWCQPHNQPLCSAFSINQREGYYITAAHCLEEGEPVIGDFEVGVVVFRDDAMDVAVIRFESIKLPALQARIEALRTGDEIAGFGFAYGLDTPLFRTAVVSGLASSGWVAFDKAWIGGMSGGPIVDGRGRVVGIVQKGDTVAAWAVPMWKVVELTAPYWESQ